ncbi:MAG: hypothetical protein ACTSO9_15465, partial [Candidatus Helarchaeota archaeon]
MFDYWARVLTTIISDIFGNQQVFYWLGVIFAIISGISNFLGSVLQKKVVNELTSDEKFFKSLIRNPLWFFGLLLQMIVGSTFYILAQIYIGPTLIPGLMASGMIVLAIGSVKIIGEELKKSEIIGIILMIFAITLIGFSGMDIKVELQNFSDPNLIIRMTIFTILLVTIAGFCKILEIKGFYQGISLAVLSGLMFAMTNFWISPLMGLIGPVLSLNFQLLELIIFVIASIILILTNIIGIATIQQSFQHAQASNMIPIQQVPIQIAPPFYYLAVYLLPIPETLKFLFFIFGIVLVMISI